MRIPIRWNLRTLLVATLLIGLCIGGYELRQRSIRYRGMAQDHAKYETRAIRALTYIDKQIKLCQGAVEMERETRELFVQSGS